jgi:anti-sigma regulatory factor (Ser/Thr protein kinase)
MRDGGTEAMIDSLEELNGQRPAVFMRFRPAWSYIDGIREFGRFFCQTTFGTPELAERACVVIQEALENAVKYSSQGKEGGELELMIQSDGTNLEISVSSLPDAAHLAQLREELSDLHTLAPEQAYLAAFLRAANEQEKSSRLGLARIRYEGGLEVSLQEQEGGRIRITATGKL